MGWGWIWFVLIAAGVAWAIGKKRKGQKSSHVYEEWPPKRKPIPEDAWRDDPATDKQLDYLESLGGRIPARGLTKGEASDRISKLEPIDEDDAAVLRYFKVSTKGVSKDSAARAVEALMKDETHQKAWADRPLSIELKEFFRLAKLKVPNEMGYEAAEALKIETLKSWHAEGSPKHADWVDYERLLEELYDPDARESWGIKKPPITLVRNCIAELLEQGSTYASLADDPDELIERMLEKKPDLEAS